VIEALERMALYFADRQHVMPSFLAATALVRGVPCQDVGLDFHDFEFYEYPLLVLLDAENSSKHVRHVGVENPSTIYAEGAESGFKPCAVICLNCVTSREKWEKYTSPSGSADVFQDIVVFQTQRTSQSGETWSRGDRL
jgi:hypothetical protein